jgi:hypothetical protein
MANCRSANYSLGKIWKIIVIRIYGLAYS